MPSPFPGMDPFLESPDIFPDLHDAFITYLREHIQMGLPEPYFARIGRRVWVEVTHRTIGPDVHVLHGDVVRETVPARYESAAVAAMDPPRAVVVRVLHDERRELLVEIYTGRGENQRLVTSIEVLSLSNKTPGEHGQNLYLRKQQEILNTQVHLVEIDLLRCGAHSTAVPKDLAVEAAGAFEYHVCIHRVESLEDFLVYPIRLRNRLPEITIPLLPGDPDVLVNLQSVFNRCYDTACYQREIDYNAQVPFPPLSPDQSEWVRGIVGNSGAEVEESRTKTG